jgi:hypothetical protein
MYVLRKQILDISFPGRNELPCAYGHAVVVDEGQDFYPLLNLNNCSCNRGLGTTTGSLEIVKNLDFQALKVYYQTKQDGSSNL